MHYLLKYGGLLGRCFVAVAMIAFGVQHLVYADFVTRVAPALPEVIPGHAFLAYAFGVYLVVSGVALFWGKTARAAALLLAGVLLASFGLLYLPSLATHPGDMGLWVKAGKDLTLCGGALLIAGSLPKEIGYNFGAFAILARSLEKLIPFGRYFLAAFLSFCGVLHFIAVDYVAGLVPSWIPGHVFWTYFSGTALFMAGLGMSIPAAARAAAGLSALMVFLWVLMLHIPRALSNLRDSNETTAVFEAIAVTGTALLVAVLPLPVRRGQLLKQIDQTASSDGLITLSPLKRDTHASQIPAGPSPNNPDVFWIQERTTTRR